MPAGVDVGVVEVHVNTIDEVEVLMLDAVLPEDLVLPLFVDVLDDLKTLIMLLRTAWSMSKFHQSMRSSMLMW
eukprot:4974990-Amphidinium_carterae.1